MQPRGQPLWGEAPPSSCCWPCTSRPRGARRRDAAAGGGGLLSRGGAGWGRTEPGGRVGRRPPWGAPVPDDAQTHSERGAGRCCGLRAEGWLSPRRVRLCVCTAAGGPRAPQNCGPFWGSGRSTEEGGGGVRGSEREDPRDPSLTARRGYVKVGQRPQSKGGKKDAVAAKGGESVRTSELEKHQNSAGRSSQ